MLQPQVVVVSTLAASNKQVSLTRVNATNVILKARAGNTGVTRIGFATFNDVTRTWTAPVTLSASTQNTISLDPGESLPLSRAGFYQEGGQEADLQRMYAQGATDGNILEVIYQTRPDA